MRLLAAVDVAALQRIDEVLLAGNERAAAHVIALGVTSTDAWIRRLGPRWNALHRATYPIAVLAILAWGITGPLFGYSDTWQLAINSGTTIVTGSGPQSNVITAAEHTHAMLLALARKVPQPHGSLTGGATIQGILYIESPNNVEFRGTTKLQGFIVFENKNSTAVNVIAVVIAALPM